MRVMRVIRITYSEIESWIREGGKESIKSVKSKFSVLHDISLHINTSHRIYHIQLNERHTYTHTHTHTHRERERERDLVGA